MPRVVVNACYGGFELSHEAIMRYGELKNLNLICVNDTSEWNTHYYKDVEHEDNYFSTYDIEREDPILVQVVEELGKLADGRFAELRIADVPDDIQWYLDDYDGIETIREIHRTW